MPRVVVPVSNIVRTGTVIGSGGTEVTGDSGNNHYLVNDDGVFITARNTNGATPRNVTLVAAQTVDGQSVTIPAVQIAASSAKVIGPFPASVYNQGGADAGNVFFNVDSSDLKLQAWKAPR